jgi:adhesin transport system outer membrane protein
MRAHFLFYSLALVLLPAMQAKADLDGLQAALHAALTRNPVVLGKQAQLRASGLQVEAAKAGRLPSFSLQANELSNSSNSGQARLRQPLWAFGKIDGAIELAEARAAQSRAELLQSSRQLLEETAATYAQLLGLRARLQVAERNVEEHERLLGLISRRREGGVASEADQRLANSRLISARANRDQLQGALDNAVQELYALTRAQLAAQEPVATTLLELPAEGELQAQAELQEAGILLRKVAVRVAERSAAQVKAELLPTLYAQFEHDIAANSARGYSRNRFGLVLEARVDGFGLFGSNSLKAAAALIAAAEEELHAARHQTQRRISSLLTQRRTQQQLIEAQQEALIAVEETLASYLRQFDAGRKSWLDVLNTQRELADIRQQLEAARSNWQEQSLRLGALLGRLDGLAGLDPDTPETIRWTTYR